MNETSTRIIGTAGRYVYDIAPQDVRVQHGKREYLVKILLNDRVVMTFTFWAMAEDLDTLMLGRAPDHLKDRIVDFGDAMVRSMSERYW